MVEKKRRKASKSPARAPRSLGGTVPALRRADSTYEELGQQVAIGGRKLAPLQRQLSSSTDDGANVSKRRFLAGAIDCAFLFLLICLANASWWLWQNIDFRCDTDGDNDCDASDVADIFSVLFTFAASVGRDTDAASVKKAGNSLTRFVLNIAHTLTEAGATYVVGCAVFVMLLALAVVVPQGLTPGKFLCGLVTVDADNANSAHAGSLFRLAASAVLLPISAVQLLLLGHDATLLDALAASKVVSSICDQGTIVAKAAELKRANTPRSEEPWKKTGAAPAAPKKRRAPSALASAALTSFAEREVQDVLPLALYAGATCYLFRDVPLEVPRSLPNGSHAWFAQFVEVLAALTQHTCEALSVCAVALGVCVCCALLIKTFFGPKLALSVPWALTAYVAYSYFSELYAAPPGALFGSSDVFAPNIYHQVVTFLIQHGAAIATLLVMLRLMVRNRAALVFSATVVNESYLAMSENVLQCLLVPALEGLFQVYQLWLLTSLATERDVVVLFLRAAHLLWTVFSLRGVIQIATSNCTGKWYFADVAPGKFNAVTRPLDATLTACTKQLGSGIFGGALMLVVYVLNTVADYIEKKNAEISWFNLFLLPAKVLLFLTSALIRSLAYYLERLVDAGFAFVGLTGDSFYESASRGKKFVDSHLGQMLAGNAIIETVTFAFTFVMLVAVNLLVLEHSERMKALAPSLSKATISFIATYMVCVFGWLLKCTCDALIVCVIEDQKYASAQLQAATTEYKKIGWVSFGLLRFFFAVAVFVAIAFTFEYVAQQQGQQFTGIFDLLFTTSAPSNTKLVKIGRIALHGALLVFGAFC